MTGAQLLIVLFVFVFASLWWRNRGDPAWLNQAMRRLLALWALAFPVVAVLYGLPVGLVLLAPWLIGVVVLGALAFATR